MFNLDTSGHLCQTEADPKGPVHSLHGCGIQAAKSPNDPFPVNGTDLVRDDNGASREAALNWLDNDLCGEGRNVES